MNHSHHFDSWPFNDAVNTASFTTRPVLEGLPILEVYHDREGDWQFLCGTTLDESDLKIVCMGCMLERDDSLAKLGQMPLGWCAYRESPQAPWVLEPYGESDET